MSSSDGKRPGGQLSLEFPHEVALGPEDFFISPSNEQAFDLVTAWPQWPKRTLVLVGPPGSGKTHLSTIWSHVTSAAVIGASQIRRDRVPELAGHAALVIEDLPGGTLDETALFHLLNLINEQGGTLLATTASYPSEWNIELPDLASRLRALAVVELRQPDEVLLRAVLVKLFADRQLAVEESVVSYLLPRMERSIAEARRLVGLIDRKALAASARVTRPFVARVLREEADGTS